MKKLMIFILAFAFVLPVKAEKTSVKHSHKIKKRKIASVDVSGINEQIVALEARPKKKQKDYIVIADLYTQLKKYDDAIKNLKLANKPQSIVALDRLSRVYGKKGDLKEEARALELIRVTGKIAPSQLTRLGDAYLGLKKPDEAIPVYRESIQKAPKYEGAYKGMYQIYIDAKNFYDARLIIIEVLQKFGNKKFWLTEFCRIEIQQGYFDNGKNICQKAITKDPKNPENHVYLALAYDHTDSKDQARKIIFNAAKKFKKSEVTQWNAGQMSCSIKNWEQAMAQFKVCLKADKKSGRCYLDLGKTQYELKKYDVALKTLLSSCPYIKGIEVEIRRLSYDLEKNKNKNMAKKYLNATDKCTTDWFNYVKKTKEEQQPYIRNQDQCFQ